MSTASAVVPIGFKQTEIGVIPEDWNVSAIDSLIDLLTGFPFPSSNFARIGIRLLRGANIKRGTLDWSENTTEFWPAASFETQKFNLQVGDVVVAMDGSLVGRSFAQISLEDTPALLVQRVARIRSKFLDMNFLKEWVCSIKFTTYCDSVKTVTAIPHISPLDIKSFKIAFPNDVREQEKIAKSLSDSESLIQSLENLIFKKQDIKQGAMRELLIGKTRLPGFTKEWKSQKLENIGMTFGGLTGKSKDDFGHGYARYITFMNIMTNVVIDCQTLESVSIPQGEIQNAVSLGDLFFNGSSETPEEVGMCSYLDKELHQVYLNSFCFGFRPNRNSKNDGRYLAYFFRSQEGRKLMKSLAQGSTRYNISKTALLSVDFLIPELIEQEAIAEVLSDMDAEIITLEKRLEKAKALKQGMMQQLLTGKIRLVD